MSVISYTIILSMIAAQFICNLTTVIYIRMLRKLANNLSSIEMTFLYYSLFYFACDLLKATAVVRISVSIKPRHRDARKYTHDRVKISPAQFHLMVGESVNDGVVNDCSNTTLPLLLFFRFFITRRLVQKLRNSRRERFP